jgi:hypothetical protein
MRLLHHPAGNPSEDLMDRAVVLSDHMDIAVGMGWLRGAVGLLYRLPLLSEQP